MNEVLILILGASPDDPVQWAFWGADRIQLADVADNVAALEAIAERAAAAKLVLALVQGECVAMRVMPAPPRANAQFRAAASYLLEDELAESLDHLHIATARSGDGAGLAMAIKKSVLAEWRDALVAAGIEPDILTADYALLPLASERAIIVDEKTRIFGGIGLQGFALDGPVADEAVTSMLGDEGLKEIIIYSEHGSGARLRDDVRIEGRKPLGNDERFAMIARALESGGVPNLLQGAYRKRANWRGAFSPWRRAAVLAGIAAAVFCGLTFADALRSSRLADRLTEETLALHQSAFPDAQGVTPRVHARQVLASGGGKPAFLLISNHIADSLDENAGVQLDRIRYNAARSEYSVNLRFSDVAQFEAFKRTLETRGVAVTEAGGMRRTNGIYLGELRMSLS